VQQLRRVEVKLPDPVLRGLLLLSRSMMQPNQGIEQWQGACSVFIMCVQCSFICVQCMYHVRAAQHAIVFFAGVCMHGFSCQHGSPCMHKNVCWIAGCFKLSVHHSNTNSYRRHPMGQLLSNCLSPHCSYVCRRLGRCRGRAAAAAGAP
jgi:hypothetical protein